ncbi:MAG: hypothetical protein U5J64_00935 [Halobacteriales archaeon]|nr:hypothetical protein [Halobacteriales archaeon]
MSLQPEFKERYWNEKAKLPYGVTPEDFRESIEDTYQIYGDISEYLLDKGYGRIEFLIRANNALSDLIGNIATESLAEASDALVHNQQPDGWPDLLPADHYDDYKVMYGEEGIETKCSKSSGGWNAHNNEEGWFTIFRYERGDKEKSAEEMEPIRFVQVMVAHLEEEDWSHSGRSEESRRTITSAVQESGMDKLRSNPVYEDPEYISGRAKFKEEYKENHAEFDPVFAEENPGYATEKSELDDFD